MGDHTGKQFVYPTKKQSRDAPPERKGMDIVYNEEECSTSETRQRYTPLEEGAGVSCVRRSALWRCVNHTHRSILPGLCLPLANCLVSSFNLTGPWVFLKRSAQLFFLRWLPPQRRMGAWSHLLQGGAPFSFNPQELPAHVQTGKSSLTSGVGTYLSIGFIRAQLLPLALSLEFWDENKGSTLPHLTTPGVWPEAHCCPPHKYTQMLTVLVRRQLLWLWVMLYL